MAKLWLPRRRETIGFEKTHSESRDVSEYVVDSLMRYVKAVILSMQPQQGKTEVAAIAIWILIQVMKKLGKTCQFVFISALPDNALLGQTEARLTCDISPDRRRSVGYGLDAEAQRSGITIGKGLIISHASTRLRKIKLPQTDYVVWIFDEVHQRNVRDGLIDTLLREHGVYIAKPISEWETGRTKHLVLGLSATAFAHALLSNWNGTINDSALFDHRFVPPPNNYTDPGKLLKAGRLKVGDRLVDEHGHPTEFFFDRFIKFPRRLGQPGYTLVREVGEKNENLVNMLTEWAPRTEIYPFDSERGNILDLQSFLASKPNKHTIVLIRGSMRAGITMPPAALRNIVQAMEILGRRTFKCDSLIQSLVGRTSGYGNRGNYPIFLPSLEPVQDYVRYYERGISGGQVLSVPSGVRNKSGSISRSGLVTHFRSFHPDHVKIVTEAEWREYVAALPPINRSVDGRRATVNGELGFKRRDVVKAFLDGRPQVAKWTIGLKFIAPGPEANKRKNWPAGQKESFKLLSTLFPEYICPKSSKPRSEGGKGALETDITIIPIPGEYYLHESDRVRLGSADDLIDPDAAIVLQ